MELLVHYLVADGYLAEVPGTEAFEIGFKYQDSEGNEYEVSIPDHTTYYLTKPGVEFVQKWKDAQPLDSEPGEVVADSWQRQYSTRVQQYRHLGDDALAHPCGAF